MLLETSGLLCLHHRGEPFHAHARAAYMRARVLLLEDLEVVAQIRARTGLSQSEFARRYGFSPRSFQEWEQGRRKPEGAVRAYLTVIGHNPKAVDEALRGPLEVGLDRAGRPGGRPYRTTSLRRSRSFWKSAPLSAFVRRGSL